MAGKNILLVSEFEQCDSSFWSVADHKCINSNVEPWDINFDPWAKFAFAAGMLTSE